MYMSTRSNAHNTRSKHLFLYKINILAIKKMIDTNNVTDVLTVSHEGLHRLTLFKEFYRRPSQHIKTPNAITYAIWALPYKVELHLMLPVEYVFPAPNDDSVRNDSTTLLHLLTSVKYYPREQEIKLQASTL